MAGRNGAKRDILSGERRILAEGVIREGPVLGENPEPYIGAKTNANPLKVFAEGKIAEKGRKRRQNPADSQKPAKKNREWRDVNDRSAAGRRDPLKEEEGVPKKEAAPKEAVAVPKKDGLRKEGNAVPKKATSPKEGAGAEKKEGGAKCGPSCPLSSPYVLAIIAVAVLAFAFLAYLETASGNNGPQNWTYPYLDKDVMVCADNYICFYENGAWRKPQYNAGTNLTIASMVPVQNESEIKAFFGRENINLVFGVMDEPGEENAELIISATPFSYYLGRYFVAFRGENKTITPGLASDYESDEPAIFILGPGMGAEETSLKYDGKNIVVQAESFEELRLLLGRLLLIAVST
ncbi:MAG: hypothetical protein ACP5E4_00140 [Candidatus Aenigmatarchaeota archaeon]